MATILARTPVPIDTDSSTHTVALAGVNSGELILIFAASNDQRDFLTVPGFSILKNEAVRGDAWGGVFARIADGTETSIDITLDGNTKTQYVVVRIGDWGGALSSILVSDQESSIGTSIDPLNLPVTWDTTDTLFIQAALARRGNGSNDISGFSTGYANGQNYVTTSGSGGATVALADRTATVTSSDSGEDPDAVTIASSTSWAVYTIAIRDLNSDFGITSATDGPLRVGDTLTINHSNGDASGKTVTVNGSAVTPDSESSAQTVITIPDFLDLDFTFGTVDIVVTNTSNGQFDTISREIIVPAGFEQVTVTELGGIYATRPEFSGLQVGHTVYAQSVQDENGTPADFTRGIIPDAANFEFRAHNGTSWFLNLLVTGIDLDNTALAIVDNSSNPIPASITVPAGGSYDLKQHYTIPVGTVTNFTLSAGSDALPTGVTLSEVGLIANTGATAATFNLEYQLTAA